MAARAASTSPVVAAWTALVAVALTASTRFSRCWRWWAGAGPAVPADESVSIQRSSTPSAAFSNSITSSAWPTRIAAASSRIAEPSFWRWTVDSDLTLEVSTAGGAASPSGLPRMPTTSPSTVPASTLANW